MSGEEYLELKFRLHDGTDIGPRRYLSATTVATLKESILAQWPKGCGRPQLEKTPRGQFDIELVAVGIFTFANHTFLKHLEKSKFCMTQNDLMTAEYKRAEKENGPKTINDVKLINSGKILENNKTLGECRGPICDLPGGVITMHVVLRPPSAEKGNEKQPSDMPKDNKCSCTIL